MSTAGRVTHPRLRPRKGGARSWWGKAWARAVEEAAYAEGDLRAGRRAARRGDVGGISVGPGTLLAAVREGDDAWTVDVTVPLLDEVERRGLVDAVAAESGRVAALLAGDLPHALVEHAEEAGAELLPYGGEFGATCTCTGFLDPCPHALAVLVQVGWLIDDDPLVLFAVRGLGREALLGELHARSVGDVEGPGGAGRDVGELADDVEVAADAVLRARRLLDLLESGADVPDHW
ncbi:SWIM zinc finger family protein [Nocardioides panacisoli]|uniref:SWIM zinc finger family protein n=1 Tax=Nocardioides panacisoli TaxID=627624 RepID=UPI001C628612|nr:SWIM zinc finger family protein [Nocardioides panacisoli]QYJ03457.1 SWIM zinc finger family protein [Nocardioides panacisoli]